MTGDIGHIPRPASQPAKRGLVRPAAASLFGLGTLRDGHRLKTAFQMQMNFRLENRLQSIGLKFMAFCVHSGDCPCPPAQTPAIPPPLNYPFFPKVARGMNAHSSFALASEWHINAYLQLVVQPQNGNFELSTLGNNLRFIFAGI